MKNAKVLWGIIGVLFICLVLMFLVAGYMFIRSGDTPIGKDQDVTQMPTFPIQPSNTVEVPPTPTLFPTYTPLPTYTIAPTQPPTYTPYPTYTREPTQTPITDPMFTPSEPVYCRSGPSEIVWWDPKEALREGQTVKIIGKSTYEWGLWWYIEKASGTRCWVYSELGTTTGNVAGVPEVYAPATPTPTIVHLSLKNNHGGPICNIWVENSGANNWVDLINGNPMEAGEKVWMDLFPGYYDFVIYDCEGNEVDSAYNFEINPGTTKLSTP